MTPAQLESSTRKYEAAIARAWHRKSEGITDADGFNNELAAATLVFEADVDEYERAQ